MGWRASDTRELSFVDAAVPAENLLGDARQRAAISSSTVLDGGRISVAALSVGLAMGAYDEALRLRARSGSSSARPISKFQAIRSSSPTCSPRSSTPS